MLLGGTGWSWGLTVHRSAGRPVGEGRLLAWGLGAARTEDALTWTGPLGTRGRVTVKPWPGGPPRIPLWALIQARHNLLLRAQCQSDPVP